MLSSFLKCPTFSPNTKFEYILWAHKKKYMSKFFVCFLSLHFLGCRCLYGWNIVRNFNLLGFFWPTLKCIAGVLSPCNILEHYKNFDFLSLHIFHSMGFRGCFLLLFLDGNPQILVTLGGIQNFRTPNMCSAVQKKGPSWITIPYVPKIQKKNSHIYFDWKS